MIPDNREDLWGIGACVFVIFAIWGGLIFIAAKMLTSLT